MSSFWSFQKKTPKFYIFFTNWFYRADHSLCFFKNLQLKMWIHITSSGLHVINYQNAIPGKKSPSRWRMRKWAALWNETMNDDERTCDLFLPLCQVPVDRPFTQPRIHVAECIRTSTSGGVLHSLCHPILGVKIAVLLNYINIYTHIKIHVPNPVLVQSNSFRNPWL